MNDGMDAARRALGAMNGVLASRPYKDDLALADATRSLCVWRDVLIEGPRTSEADRDRLQRLNAVLSVVAGMHYPLGEVPWAPFEAAVKDLERLIAGGRA